MSSNVQHLQVAFGACSDHLKTSKHAWCYLHVSRLKFASKVDILCHPTSPQFLKSSSPQKDCDTLDRRVVSINGRLRSPTGKHHCFDSSFSGLPNDMVGTLWLWLTVCYKKWPFIVDLPSYKMVDLSIVFLYVYQRVLMIFPVCSQEISHVVLAIHL